MKRFKIELISDLCSSNGESYGSVIDTDVCYDQYGLPVIKGKPLKGCLLEIAEELTECDIIDEKFIETVFGKSGNSYSGNLIINDAVLENYQAEKQDILQMSDIPSKNQVIDCFSYTRGQTEIDSDGKAKDKSLRCIRVVKRGLSFICEYEIDSKYADNFEKCVCLLRHIGMNRTRGLGEVKCSVLPDIDVLCSDAYTDEHRIKDCNKLRYTIETLSPLIAFKHNENKSYIPGSTFEGLCFQRLGREKMIRFVDNGLKFFNSVISDGDRRFNVAPGFLAKQKKPVYDGNKMQVFVFDTEKSNDADPPTMQIKNMNFYIEKDFSEILSLPVNYEINYHHKQSQKNPGTIDGENFYQISSMCANQLFTGVVSGTPEMMSEIYNTFGNNSIIHIGYYRTSGYGKCRLTLTPDNTEVYSKKTDKIAVCLNSPAILYDNNGMPSARPDVFKEYMNELLKDNKSGIKKVKNEYLKYTTIGGYNVTWNMNKQRFQALDAGTSFVFELNEKIDLASFSNTSIGERTTEGFGELAFFDYNQIVKKASSDMYVEQYNYNVKDNVKEKIISENIHGTVAKNISEKKVKEHLYLKAIQRAHEEYDNIDQENLRINSTQIGRLLLMCDEQNNYNDFIFSVLSTNSKEINQINKPKEEINNIVLNYLDSKIKTEEDVKELIKKINMTDNKKKLLKFVRIHENDESKYNIIENPRYYKIYMLALLTEAKYILRGAEKNVRADQIND